jgi:hypothetical protein
MGEFTFSIACSEFGVEAGACGACGIVAATVVACICNVRSPPYINRTTNLNYFPIVVKYLLTFLLRQLFEAPFL